MSTTKGRNVKVEVALTFASLITPTAVTKASPGVATLTSHGLTDGMAGYWSAAAGMVELDQQGVLVGSVTSNTFAMPGLITTDYTTYTTASFYAAATWGTVSEASAYSIGGGAATELDDGRLMDVKARTESGLLAPQNLTIDIRNPVISGTALAFIESQAMRGLPCLFKITQGSNVLRVVYGTPSLPGESVAAGQLASGQLTVNCPAFAIKPNV